MRLALYYVALSVGSLYLLWAFYIVVMGLKRVHDAKQLSKTAYILGYPLFIVGYLLDIAVNVFVMSLLLLETPKEYTVTARLKRHKLAGGWRGKVAEWFEPLLDPFDPSGNHI